MEVKNSKEGIHTSYANLPETKGWLSFFLFFLGLHPLHTEVPRLEVELELQLPACTTATAMWDPSCICDSTVWGDIGSLTHMSKARDQTCILVDTSWVLKLLSHSGNSEVGYLKIKLFRNQHSTSVLSLRF